MEWIQREFHRGMLVATAQMMVSFSALFWKLDNSLRKAFIGQQLTSNGIQIYFTMLVYDVNAGTKPNNPFIYSRYNLVIYSSVNALSI